MTADPSRVPESDSAPKKCPKCGGQLLTKDGKPINWLHKLDCPDLRAPYPFAASVPEGSPLDAATDAGRAAATYAHECAKIYNEWLEWYKPVRSCERFSALATWTMRSDRLAPYVTRLRELLASVAAAEREDTEPEVYRRDLHAAEESITRVANHISSLETTIEELRSSNEKLEKERDESREFARHFFTLVDRETVSWRDGERGGGDAMNNVHSLLHDFRTRLPDVGMSDRTPSSPSPADSRPVPREVCSWCLGDIDGADCRHNDAFHNNRTLREAIDRARTPPPTTATDAASRTPTGTPE